MQINWLGVGCTSIASLAVSYVANNTTYLSTRAWEAHGKLDGLSREFKKEHPIPSQVYNNEAYKQAFKPGYKQAMMEWKDGTLKKAFEEFKRVQDGILLGSKLPPLYCGLSIGCALIAGHYITQKFGTQYDEKKRMIYAEILSLGLTALLTFSSTKSTKLTLINSSICVLSFPVRLLLSF